MFPLCEKRHCITITINDDWLVEKTKSFNITVEKYSGIGDELTINPSKGQIIIHDTDGMSVYRENVVFAPLVFMMIIFPCYMWTS